MNLIKALDDQLELSTGEHSLEEVLSMALSNGDTCPDCGTPIKHSLELDSVDYHNSWECPGCGQTWTD